MAVADPDAAPEAPARTGHDETARDGRGRCGPRRAWPAMVHVSVLSVGPVPVDSPPPPGRPIIRAAARPSDRSGVVSGMFDPGSRAHDDPSVRGAPVLAATASTG